MQIQAAFNDLGLDRLGNMGLEVFLQIPHFKDCCPLCRGSECAVRHGLYFRRVVDRDGSNIEHFPIPRFRCRQRGPVAPSDTTFSVLPAGLIPRQRMSLSLNLMILKLVEQQKSMARVLDDLAGRAPEANESFSLEETSIYRIIRFFSRAYRNLDTEELGFIGIRTDRQGTRQQALELSSAITRLPRSNTGAAYPVLQFHDRFFPQLLLAAHTR